MLHQKITDYECLCEREKQLLSGKQIDLKTSNGSTNGDTEKSQLNINYSTEPEMKYLVNLRSKSVENSTCKSLDSSLEDVLNEDDISIACSEDPTNKENKVNAISSSDPQLSRIISTLKYTATLPRVKLTSKKVCGTKFSAKSLPPSTSQSYDCLKEEDVAKSCTCSRAASPIKKVYPAKSEPNTSDDRDFVTKL